MMALAKQKDRPYASDAIFSSATPWRQRLRIGPQAFPPLSCFLFQPFQHRIPGAYFLYHQYQPSLTSE